MESKLWDTCDPDSEQTALLVELEVLVRGNVLSRKSSGAEGEGGAERGAGMGDICAEETKPLVSVRGGGETKVNKFSAYDHIHDSLEAVEHACQDLTGQLDAMLSALEGVERAHSDVTGRTNSLMVNCETLLEQQHTLQSVVDQLRTIIAPFNDVEEVAGQLGIPVDAAGRPYANSQQASTGTSLSGE
jgi:hypothetical protein